MGMADDLRVNTDGLGVDFNAMDSMFPPVQNNLSTGDHFATRGAQDLLVSR